MTSAAEISSPQARFRCLYCAYPLMEHDEPRCSECGMHYERSVLERWFGGEEENRLERVLWLVRACVFLKLWVLWDYRGLAYAASAGAAGWACWIAGQGKRQTVAWQYAVGGMVMAVLVLVSTWWSGHFGPITPMPFEIACAGLLLGAVFRDADRQKLWAEPIGSRIGLAMILAAPLLAIGFDLFSDFVIPQLRAQGTLPVNIFGAVTSSSYALDYWLPVLLPHAFALIAWTLVWWRLSGMHRAMFRERHEPVESSADHHELRSR